MGIHESEQYLNEWKERQSVAEKLIPLVGEIYRDRGIVVQVFGRRIMNSTVIDIIKAHRYARQLGGSELDLARSYEMLQLMNEMPVSGPARVDVGKLAAKYDAAGSTSALRDFLTEELRPIVDNLSGDDAPRDVVLYGFGRIGRLLARLLIERTGSGNKMRLRAIVVRGGREGDLQKRASLLRRDDRRGGIGHRHHGEVGEIATPIRFWSLLEGH